MGTARITAEGSNPLDGTHPQPPGRGEHPDGDRAGAGWWWWLVVVAVALVVVLLVVQPWAEHETEPPPTGTPSSASDVPTGSASPPVESVTPPVTPQPAPGAEAVFDATSLATLFVTDAELVAHVPAAAPGVVPGIGPGELPWGLPAGSTITPESCTTTVTVVAEPPAAFDARSSGNDAFSWEQRVTVLDDAAAALEAFRALVTTVDACPEYAQVNPGIDGASWIAEPAIEGQGGYPSIVQERTHAAEGSSLPEYRGHMLVGNAIVTWTATSLATGSSPEEALATLGEPSALDAMVEARAQQAVDGLG